MAKPVLYSFFVSILVFIFLQAARLVACEFSVCNLNKGIILGVLNNNILGIASLAIFLVAFVLLWRKGSLLWFVFIGAILSNLFERIVFGGVNDYIDFTFIPSFNAADIIIVLGLFSFAIFDLHKQKLPV